MEFRVDDVDDDDSYGSPGYRGRFVGPIIVVILVICAVVYVWHHLRSFEVAGVVIVGIGVVVLALRNMSRSKASAPLGITPVALAQIKPGMYVDTLGLVRSADTFRGPISGRACAWYRVRVHTAEDPKLLTSIDATERLDLTDGGELSIVVHTDHALFSVHKTELQSLAASPNALLAEFIAARNLPVDVRAQDLVVTEDLVEVGETVFVRGVARTIPALATGGPSAYRSGDTREGLELIAAPGHPVAIGLSPIPKDEADLEAKA